MKEQFAVAGVFTLLSSTQRVIMTIVLSWYSHTICQNFTTVSLVGPAIYTGEKVKMYILH